MMRDDRVLLRNSVGCRSTSRSRELRTQLSRRPAVKLITQENVTHECRAARMLTPGAACWCQIRLYTDVPCREIKERRFLGGVDRTLQTRQ